MEQLEQNTTWNGLMCNVQCYVRDLGNDIDSPLTRANIEECLVNHAAPEDVRNSKKWLIEIAPLDINQWHPKVKTLCQFIEMQAMIRS